MHSEEDDEEKKLEDLNDYTLSELQELISVAHRSFTSETDVILKKIKKKRCLNVVRHYNKRVGFKAYKETL